MSAIVFFMPSKRTLSLVWPGRCVDTNSNGVTEAGELLTLAQAGVQSFNVSYASSDGADANGNQHRQLGRFTTTDETAAKFQSMNAANQSTWKQTA